MKTKKIVTFFLFFVMMQNINAQVFLDYIPTPIENWGDNGPFEKGYFKDINGHFDKFIGTWEYNNTDKYLKIQFYKVEKVPTFFSGFFFDRLCSFMEYKEKQNGEWVTIYNTFGSPLLTSFNFDYDTIQGKGVISNNTNLVSLNYTEPSEGCRDLSGFLTLLYQTGNPPQLIWKIEIAPGFEPPECDFVDESDFKIPANLVLTKISNP